MKQEWAAPERNKDPILAVLREVLPAHGVVLEVASGTGQHAVHFATHLDVTWQPSDRDPEHLASIRAWRAETGLENLNDPLVLDVLSPFPLDRADAVYCANMIHIAPWACTLGLLDGAAAVLEGGPLVLYGPFQRGGAHTAPSNAAFHESLRERDPSWGVRELEVVAEEAARRGFRLDRVVEMPANNLVVVFRR